MQKLGPGDPQQIGAYRVLGRLGAGSLGQVFLARSDRGRTAAVKVIRRELAEQEEFRATLRQDVQAARRAGGRWTAPVLDADIDAEVPWVATAHVAGPSLQDVVDRDHGALPERSVHILAAGLAHALQDVHAAGLVHRALKPSNVLVAVEGPRVVDVGFARALQTTGATLDRGTGSGSGWAAGSPAFQAPEQVRGELITPASDVFSLGAVLAYAATGKRPFGATASGLHALMFRITHEDPDLEGLPESLSELVSACLRKDPATRPGVPELLARTGGSTSQADGRSPDHWLPAAVVSHLAHIRATAERPTAVDLRDHGQHDRRDRQDRQDGTERAAEAGRGPTASGGVNGGASGGAGGGPGRGANGAAGPGAGERGPESTGSLPTVISKGAPGNPSSPFVTPSPTGPFGPPGSSGSSGSSGSGSSGSSGTPVSSGPRTSPGRAAPPGPAAAPGRATPPGPPRPAGPGPVRPAPAPAPGVNGAPAWPPVGHGSAAPRPGAPGAAPGAGAQRIPLNPRVPDASGHGPRPAGSPAPPAPVNGVPVNGHPGALPPAVPGRPRPAAAAPPPGTPAPWQDPHGASGAPGTSGAWQGAHGAPAPGPSTSPPPDAAAPNSRRSTIALIIAALIVVAGAGASLYALMHGDGGGRRGAHTGHPSHPAVADQDGGAPGGDRSHAPSAGRPTPSKDGPGLVPARYLGTWSGGIDTAAGRSTRRLVITQGEVGDTVLSLTADGPTDGGGSYHCVFKAPLQSKPTAKGPLRIGPSVVTVGEPAASCTPGVPTTVTVLPDGSLQRTSTDNGEKLTYRKKG